MPPIGDAERLGQLADDRQVRRGVLVHDAPGIRSDALRILLARLRRLQHIIVHKPVHRRAAPRGAAQSKNLHVEIVEQFPRTDVRKERCISPFGRPGPDLFDGPVRPAPRIGFRQVEPVELLALRVKLPEHIVEGAVLEHEDDDMFDSRHLLTIGLRA